MKEHQETHDKALDQARQRWIDVAMVVDIKNSKWSTDRPDRTFCKRLVGLFGHLDHNVSPIHRLVHDSNEVIASAVQTGFVKLLYRDGDLPSSDNIAELRLVGKMPGIGQAVLAGLDIIAERSRREFLGLPDDALKAGLCLDLAVPTGQRREWPSWIMGEKPKLAAETLVHRSRQKIHPSLAAHAMLPRLKPYRGADRVNLLNASVH